MADVVPVHGVHVFVPDRIVAHGRPPPSPWSRVRRGRRACRCFRVRVCVPVRGVWPGCRVAFFDRVDEADVPAARVDDDLRELAYRLRRDAGESDEAHLGRGFRLAVFRTVRFSPDAIRAAVHCLCVFRHRSSMGRRSGCRPRVRSAPYARPMEAAVPGSNPWSYDSSCPNRR